MTKLLKISKKHKSPPIVIARREYFLGYTLKRNCATTGAVLALAVVGYIIKDDLAHLVSLIGAFFGIPLAFILPSLLHNKIVCPTGIRRISNNMVIGFGCVAMLGATVITIYSWSDKDSDANHAGPL